MNKKNSYEKAAKKKGLLGEITQDLETKHDLKNSAIETGKDLVVGVLGGGVVGALIGKASLLIGAAVTGIGHYYKSRMASLFGVGMMAANGFEKPSSGAVSGTDGKASLVDEAKERVMTFKDSFSKKLYLDKLQSKKTDTKTETTKADTTKNLAPAKEETTGEEKTTETKPVGEVQYFIHPSGRNIDLSKLDTIENSLHSSAAKFQQQQTQQGEEGTEGLGTSEQLDPEEKNY